MAISIITLTELLAGMRPGEEAAIEKLLSLFRLIPVDEMIGRGASAYLRSYRRSHRVELGDALIAASAAQFKAEIVTRNVKHYPMTDLTVIVPYVRGKV